MRFQVPQFIEVEDKIFGPLTIKQFLYLAGGGGAIFIIYRFVPFFIALLLIVPVASLALALAFYKVNNKPFIFVLEAAFHYLLAQKLYIWKKIPKQAVHKEQDMSHDSLFVPKLSDSKLKDMTWSLDVKQSLNPVTEDK
jgi:hypothetical protein